MHSVMVMATVVFNNLGTGRLALPVGTLYVTTRLTGASFRSFRTCHDQVRVWSYGYVILEKKTLTAVTTVRAPEDGLRQLWGFCMKIASCMGYEFPLLSKFRVVPLAMFRRTVKEEMPVDTGIF
jgi:hypothetical protein